MQKKIAILGSTGSIGRQTLEVVTLFPSRFKVSAMAAKDELKLIEEQVNKFTPKLLSVCDELTAQKIQDKIKITTIINGPEGLKKVATAEGVNVVVVAIPGTICLIPTLEAIKAGKDIALASKEVLVAAGSIVMEEVAKAKVQLIPIDSEHSAIFQCLVGEDRSKIKRLILTASGGPFLDMPAEKLAQMTKKEALAHPTWKMGPKVSIDSSTLMNKGLEVIEAHHLFGIPYSKIEVVIHPQSIIHSMVEFIDGSVKAQLSSPDMRVPIQYALTYPDRMAGNWTKTDFTKIGTLNFKAPDLNRFPCLALAYEAGEKSGTMPTVMNAANEVAVELFLNGKISFMDIPRLIKETMAKHNTVENPTLDDILEADRWARGQLQA